MFTGQRVLQRRGERGAVLARRRFLPRDAMHPRY